MIQLDPTLSVVRNPTPPKNIRLRNPGCKYHLLCKTALYSVVEFLIAYRKRTAMSRKIVVKRIRHFCLSTLRTALRFGLRLHMQSYERTTALHDQLYSEQKQSHDPKY